MAFKAAVCPSCGGQLQVPDDRDTVKCMYCGTDIIVRQAIQAGSGVNIKNYIELAVTAQKAGNYQEAYNYYSKVLEIEIKNPEAWFGKARAAGWLSTIDDPRFPEVISGFQNAIANISDKNKNNLQIQCGSTIYELSSAYFNLIYKYVTENSSVDGVWEKYLARSEGLMSLLEFGHSLDPNNQNIITRIIQICKANLEGVAYIRRTSDGTTHDVRRVSESYVRVFTNKMNEYSTKLQKLDPNYKPPTIQRKYATNEIICICCIVVIIIIFLMYVFTKH